jgi:predicted nucleotidyltransferase
VEWEARGAAFIRSLSPADRAAPSDGIQVRAGTLVTVMVEFPPQIHERVAEICIRAGVARLELTGSAARDDFDPSTSDIDLLVEFLPGNELSALAFIELAHELESVLGRRVDLLELSAVENPILREAFLRDRVPFYAAA